MTADGITGSPAGKIDEAGLSVLLVDLAKNFGGTDVRVIQTAKALHGRCRYAVATLADSPLHQRLQEEKLVALPLTFRRGDPRLLWAILKIVRKGGFTVVDAHNFQSQMWGLLAATLSRIPGRIATVHSAYGIVTKGYRGKVQEAVLRLNVRWGCRFITVSEATKSYLSTLGVPETAIRVIHNGVPMPDTPLQLPDYRLRKTLGWSEKEYVIAVVGRLEREKGHDVLLSALQLAVRQNPAIRCLIVGDGRLREALAAQMQTLGLEKFVHFTGFRTDIPEILKAADAFCLPSRSEGLPYALLEACSFRLPLLLTAVGGMKDLFRHFETAYMVPAEDEEALAEGLCWLAEHATMAKQFGNAAYRFVDQNLSIDKMLTDTLEVYHDTSV